MKRQLGVAIGLVLAVGLIVVALVWLAGRDKSAESASPTASVSATSPEVTPSATATLHPDTSPVATPSPTTGTTTDAPTDSASSTIPGATAVLTIASLDTNSGMAFVGGFVSGVIEDGGVCLFTVTAVDTGASWSIERQGAMNVDTTTCGSHEVEVPSSQSEQFRVKMVYTNDQGSAVSETLTLEKS